MFTSNINFLNFRIKKKTNVKKDLKFILRENNQVIQSLGKSYKNKFNNKSLKNFKKKLDYRVIGMGGSTLGAQAIYEFLKKKIKKNFIFFDNLNAFESKKTKKNFNNVIISKSGNTTEKIVNSNIKIKKKDKNLFITEKKKKLLKFACGKIKS